MEQLQVYELLRALDWNYIGIDLFLKELKVIY